MEKNYFFDVFSNLGINNDVLYEIAYETGLIKRRRIIEPQDLLYAICIESSNGTVSIMMLRPK